MRDINKFNEKDEEIGYWEILDGDGNLWQCGNYENGKRIGIWKNYDKNGNVTSVNLSINPSKDE